jgi:hypothetical protein
MVLINFSIIEDGRRRFLGVELSDIHEKGGDFYPPLQVISHLL